jgi:hypothetical protein
MNRKSLFILICIVSAGCVKNSFASNDKYPAGAREAAMANSSVIISDIWAVFHNQAALANLNNPALGFYHERRFMLSQLSHQAISLAIPVKPGTIAASYSSFGYSIYHETKVGLAFARKLSKGFSVGIKIDYLHTRISGEYGKSGTLTAEGGILAEPFPNFLIGAHIFNPVRQDLSGQGNEKIPTVFTLGCGYSFINKVLVTIGTEKDLIHKPVFNSGIEFELADRLFLRTGVSTRPVFFTFGLGYSVKKIMIDVALTRHQLLGNTPHFSMSYLF